MLARAVLESIPSSRRTRRCHRVGRRPADRRPPPHARNVA